MKLQIDTTNKIIRIEEAVNLNELLKMVKALFPNDTWKEYKLETAVIKEWINPIVVNPNPYNVWPWHVPYYTNCGDLTVSGESEQPVYNVSVNYYI